MPEQRELLLTFPELAPEAPLIPVRMVNEYVYCPRLAYLEWVQGEFAHSADTVDGAIKHKRVDQCVARHRAGRAHTPATGGQPKMPALLAGGHLPAR